MSNTLADRASIAGLTLSSVRALSRLHLVQKFGISQEEAAALKAAVVRQPILDHIVDVLLERSNFTCNICKGSKSPGFIILHHIVPYGKPKTTATIISWFYARLATTSPTEVD